MIDSTQIERIFGADVRGPDDAKIGTAGRVYLSDTTGQATWVIVTSGLFGKRESFVPLQDATWDGEVLRLPYDKDVIKDAPNSDPDGHLSVDEEQVLYAYYGVDTAVGEDAVPPAPSEDVVPRGYEGAGEAVSDDEFAVVLHEDRPVVSVQAEPVERVRLTTETVASEEAVTGEVRKEQFEVDGDVNYVDEQRGSDRQV